MCAVAVIANIFIVIAGVLGVVLSQGFSSQCTETSHAYVCPPKWVHLIDEGWDCIIALA